MDIRIQKTETAIKNAFMELRAQKPIEKITVKELCRLAQINKSTFYAHYDDIYALSDAMQAETIAFVLGTISQQQEWSVKKPGALTRAIFQAISAHRSLINGLFPLRERTRLANALETGIKEMLCQKYPELRGDVKKSILLSFCIQGAYHAYLNHQNVDPDALAATIEEISQTLRPLYESFDSDSKSP